MKINLKTNYSLFTLLFIFLELWIFFSALKLLSAWKHKFQDYLHQVFDTVDLKNARFNYLKCLSLNLRNFSTLYNTLHSIHFFKLTYL